MGEINKQKRKVSEITINQISTKFDIKPYKFRQFIKENEKYRPIVFRLRWAQKDENVLNSFLRAFEQVAKSLPADTPAEPEAPTPDTSAESEPEDTEPEPPEEEEPREKSPDPTFTRRATTRIKKYYNELEISDRLPHKFNTWKKKIETLQEVESIKEVKFGENDKLYLITLTNGEQFGLPKQAFSPAIEFAFGESGVSKPGTVPLKKVLKLAKIKDGKIIKKGSVQYHDSMEESLMLRWKTIAGIK